MLLDGFDFPWPSNYISFSGWKNFCYLAIIQIRDDTNWQLVAITKSVQKVIEKLIWDRISNLNISRRFQFLLKERQEADSYWRYSGKAAGELATQGRFNPNFAIKEGELHQSGLQDLLLLNRNFKWSLLDFSSDCRSRRDQG